MAVAAALAACYALGVNLLAFALFGIDKRRAEAGAWRIRESTLIGVALAGGWIGAKAAQRHFRYKTRKQPFARRLNAVGVVNLGLLVILASVTLAPPAEVAAGVEWVTRAFEGLVPAGGRGLGAGAPEPGAIPRRFGPGSGDGM